MKTRGPWHSVDSDVPGVLDIGVDLCESFGEECCDPIITNTGEFVLHACALQGLISWRQVHVFGFRAHA